jgi:glycerol-3-phosphate acyltransferase PlsY
MIESIIISGLILLSAYLIGSIPFAIILTRLLSGTDVRSQGSGHAGATNTMRAVGWLPGIFVMVLDIMKGVFSAWLTATFAPDPVVIWLAAALVIMGHCWPVFAGFRGGMGMATAGGVLLYTWPLGFVLGIGLAAAMQLIVRHSARANVATALLLTPLWLLFGVTSIQLGTVLASSLILGIRSTSDWRREYRELWFDRDLDPPE